MNHQHPQQNVRIRDATGSTQSTEPTGGWLPALGKELTDDLPIVQPLKGLALVHDADYNASMGSMHIKLTPMGSTPHSSSDGGLPRFCGGSAPTLRVSRPARRSLALRPACSRSRLWRPFPSAASAASLPPPPLRLLPAGTTRVAGRDLHPLKIRAFSRRTQKPTLRLTE